MRRSNGKPQRRDSKVLPHVLSKVFETEMVTRKALLSDENNLINFPAIKH